MAEKKIDYLIDTEPLYFVLISHTGPLSSKSCTVTRVDGKPRTIILLGISLANLNSGGFCMPF